MSTGRLLRAPAHLRAEADVVIESAHRGVHSPPGAAFDLLTSWCEVRPDESGLQSAEYGGGFIVIPTGGPVDGCSDEDMALAHGVPRDAISPRMRVAYLRSRLCELLKGETDESEIYPMACWIRLRGETTKRAVLGYFTTGGGYRSDPDIEWIGVFRNVHEWRQYLRTQGYLTGLSDVRHLGETDAARLWASPR
jgi:hypothetical protein